MPQEELVERFVEVIRSRAKNAGRRVGDDLQDDLRNFFKGGAAQLHAIQDASKRNQAIERAERDIVRLADFMIQEAMRLTRVEDYPRDVMGERTFAPARLRFCPCPPIC